MKNAPSLNGRALHYSPTRWIHACSTHYITFNITACLLCRDALRFTRNGLARVVAAISFHRSAFAYSLLLLPLQCLPSPFPRPGFIHHARVSTSMYDVCTDNAVASHDAPHHDAHSWRGHVHNCAARMHACEATDRKREEWWRLRSARGGRAVSKPVRNSEREQREVRRDSVFSFFSAFVSSFSAVASRLPSGAPKFLFSLKGETGEKHTVAI